MPNNRTVIHFIFFCFITIGSSINLTYADSPAPPFGYEISTKDGRFIFVMNAGQGRAIENPEAYKHSGLYPIDQPENPVWTIDWYASSTYMSEDGELLVRLGPWATDIYDLAIAFYRSGELLNAYRISDLVEDEKKLHYTVSHFFWKKSIEWDEKSHVVLLETVEGIEYSFDAETGLLFDAFR